MKAQAAEALDHAALAGEEVTTLGRAVFWVSVNSWATSLHVDDMLKEMLVLERHGIALYTTLLHLVNGRHIALEEYARSMVRNELLHVAEIETMLRTRGDA